MPTIAALTEHPPLMAGAVSLCTRTFAQASGFGPEDWQSELERICAHPVEEVFVATDSERVLGLACLVERETPAAVVHLSPWLSALAVAPEARGSGLARVLVDRVRAHASDGGYRNLYALSVLPGLFFRLGWEAIDTTVVRGAGAFVFRSALDPR